MATLAQFHYDNRDFVHGTGVIQFFIWHRALLFDFEERIRSLPGFECVTIPYWNYDYSDTAVARADRRSPFGTTPTKLGQGDEAGGCIGGAFASYQHTLDGAATCIRRQPNTDMMKSLRCSTFVDLAGIGEQNFVTFADNLQNAHGIPHISFGGMFSTHFSPIDPLFYLHHANVDRVWDMWQACHVDYKWYESAGLNAPLRGYQGVTAGDFIDNSQSRWKGRTYSVRYASDQWQDPSVYSSDFRRNVVTRCREGKLSTRYDPVSPILGVDDEWARESVPLWVRSITFNNSMAMNFFPPIPVSEAPTPVQCTSPGGTDDFATLKTVSAPIAVYDNYTFQGCRSKCQSFYFKLTGPSNCICLTWALRAQTQTTLADPRVYRFYPRCDGPETNYGYYVIPPSQQQSGRRLLQQPPPPTPLPAVGGVCLDVPVAQKEAVSVACEDEESTPPALPQKWLENNNINLDRANLCTRFKPAEASKNIECLNQL